MPGDRTGQFIYLGLTGRQDLCAHQYHRIRHHDDQTLRLEIPF